MKRVFALFLTLMMVVGCMTILPMGTAAADSTVSVWNGSESTKPAGRGTEDEPYLIDSAADLKYLAGLIAPGNGFVSCIGTDHTLWKATYSKHSGENDNTLKEIQWQSLLDAPYIYIKQIADIDLGGYQLPTIGSYWAVEGQNKAQLKGQFFRGEYDGQGHVIKNGTTKAAGNARWAGGLFGYVWNATIKNLRFDDMDYVDAGNGTGNFGFAASSVIGPHYFARGTNYANLLAADPNTTKDQNGQPSLDSLIRSVPNEVYNVCEEMGETLIENVVVTNTCTIKDEGDGGRNAIGGIVGEANNTTIRNCAAAATYGVSGPGQYIGGIVGAMVFNTIVDNCSFSGNIGGGGTMNGSTFRGGIVGLWTGLYSKALLEEGYARDNYGVVSNCFVMGGNSRGVTGVPSNGDNTAYNSFAGGVIGGTYNLYSAGTNSTYTVEDCTVVFTSIGQAPQGRAQILGMLWTEGADASTEKGALYAPLTLKNCVVGNNLISHSAGGAASKSGTADGSTHKTTPQKLANYMAWSEDAAAGVTEENCLSYASMHCFLDPVVKEKILWTTEMQMDGKGTEADPYKVDSQADLDWIAYCTGDGGSVNELHLIVSFDGKYFVQTQDIDLNNATQRTIGYYFRLQQGDMEVKGTHYSPNGDLVEGTVNYKNLLRVKGTAFGGSYDGQGYSIKNGKIQCRSNANQFWASGLFGVIYGATVKNVVMENVTMTGATTSAGLVVGLSEADWYRLTPVVDEETGAITNHTNGGAALMYSGYNTIENCTVLNSTLHNNGDKNNTIAVGAVVGQAYATTIRNCYADATVQSSGGDVGDMGGIVGRANVGVKIENCVFAGNLKFYEHTNANGQNSVGGILGNFEPLDTPAWNDSLKTTLFEMKNCVNMGTIQFFGQDGSETAADAKHVRKAGGLIGQIVTKYDTTKGVKITDCYNLGDIILPDTYTASNRLDMGTLVGVIWIPSDPPEVNAYDTVEFYNCAGIAVSALSGGKRSGYVEVGTDADGNDNAVLALDDKLACAFVRYPGRITTDNIESAIIYNDEELKAVTRTEEEVAELTKRANAVLSGFKDTKGIKNYGVQSKVEEGKLSLRFINMLAYDLPVESISSISYSYIIAGDKDYESRTFSVTKVYEAVGSADGAKIVAPQGYYYMFAAEVGNGMTTEGTYTITLNLSYALTDGGKVTQLPVTVNVVNGVVSYN